MAGVDEVGHGFDPFRIRLVLEIGRKRLQDPRVLALGPGLGHLQEAIEQFRRILPGKMDINQILIKI